MKPEDAERWKSLERRARDRGWTIDFLQLGADWSEAAMGSTPTKPSKFALTELYGGERTLATGSLDTIEAFLTSSESGTQDSDRVAS